MNEQEKNILLNQKDDKVQIYENDDAYLFGEDISGDGSLEVGYKNSFNENNNKLINQKELLNKFNTNISQDEEQEQEQELEQEPEQEPEQEKEQNLNQNQNIENNNNFENENIQNNNNNFQNQNNSFKDKKYEINDINSDMENEDGGEDEEENQENLEENINENENENEKINDNDNYIIDNQNINKTLPNKNINNNMEANNNINNNINNRIEKNNNIENIENQNEELDENENDSDSGVPLVTLNFLSICQCCKNSFNSKENIPYLFKCGHFFCKQCIIEQFTDEEGIKCPNDGLIANSISDLKILNNFITDKTVTQRTSSPFATPDAGDKNKINAKISKNKNINNTDNIQNYPYKSCEFHKGQKLTHFIEETKELICVYCAFERFKQNQGMEIKEITDKCHDMETEMDSIIEENQYNVGIIQTSLKEIKKNKENEEKKINEIFERFTEMIKTKKDEFLTKIDNLFTNNAEKLSQKLELFSNKIEKSENVKEKINIFLNNQDSSQFLQLYEYYNKIKNELQSLHSLKLNLQKYNFNYEDEMSISRMISKFGEIKLSPKIFTFIGETNKEEKDYMNENNLNNMNNMKKFEGIKVKLNNNNVNYNNMNINTDNINCQNTFQKYNNINDNIDNRDCVNMRNNSSTNFYKSSVTNNNNAIYNDNCYQINSFQNQKNNININNNKYNNEYANKIIENKNIYKNKNNNNIDNNHLINYDKYSIPKAINNEILNKGRNSSLNGGIRLNTPN